VAFRWGRASPCAAPRGALPYPRPTAFACRCPHTHPNPRARADAVEAVAAAAAAPAAPAAPALPSAEAASSLVSGALGQAGDVTAALGGKASDLAGAAGAATSQAASAAAAAAQGLTSQLAGLKSGVGSAVGGLAGVTGGVKDSLAGVTGGVKESLGSALGGASGALQGATSQLTESLGGATSAATSALSGATEAAAGYTRALTETVGGAFGGATSQLQGAVDAANAQAGALSSQAEAQLTAIGASAAAAVDAATAQALDQLPPPARDALVAVGGAAVAGAGAAADAAAAHPQGAAITAAAVAVPTALAWYAGRFGGYAGELAPAAVAALLADGDAALIDIRPAKQREAEGTPELKLAARFKVAAFPADEAALLLPPRVTRAAGNAGELRTLTHAALIAGLKQVKGPATRVVIMDRDGGDEARALARALTGLSKPTAYVMTGGFRGWRDAAGLPVAEAADYAADAGALLADNVEVVAGKLSELSAPTKAVPLGAGLLGAGVALANYHTTLEFIGVLGTLLLAVRKALSYSSPGEALDDVRSLASQVSGLAASAANALPKGGAAAPGGGGGGGAPSFTAPKLPSFGGGASTNGAPRAAAQAPAPKPAPTPAPKPAPAPVTGIKDGAISDVATAGEEGSA
jgi:rhodanese-related sulfurtransferase